MHKAGARALLRLRRRLARTRSAFAAAPLVDGYEVVDVGGRRLSASPDPGLTPEEVKQQNLDLLVDVFERADIPYFLVRGFSPMRHRVGVPAQHRRQVLTLLAAACDGRAVYAARLRGSALGDIALATDVTRPDSSDADVLRVFQVHVRPDGASVLGGEYGCDLEFWREEPAALVGPRRNQVSHRVPAPLATPTDMPVRDRTYRTLAPFTAPLVEDVDFPIDVVYTWVDGSDPEWLARKAASLPDLQRDTHGVLATDASRFLDRDELKYSLRSLASYAPFVRNVYVVTDDQVPPWLRTDHPRLRVVSHREIFESPDVLPTYNSHAIESQLHHIDGLSEHYLYLNDDVFLGRLQTPLSFFHGNGLAKFFHSRNGQVDLGDSTGHDSPLVSSGKNNRKLIESHFGRRPVRLFQHVPHSQLRSVLVEMERTFPAEFERTAAHRFRHVDDISVAAALHHDYAYLTRRAVPATLHYAYVDIAEILTAEQLREEVPWSTFDVFCLNDKGSSGSDAGAQARAVRGFLEGYFPHPCQFEKGQPSTSLL